MSKPVKYALFLGILGILVGALLAFVNFITAPKIAEQEKAKIMKSLNTYYESEDWKILEEGEYNQDNVNGAYTLSLEGKTIYAFKSTGKGYKSGNIVTMVFIENGIIKEVSLVSVNDQTKGIGTKIEEQSYLDTFKNVEASKYFDDSSSKHNSKNSVDVISGATYSSRGVITAVIQACNEYRDLTK